MKIQFLSTPPTAALLLSSSLSLFLSHQFMSDSTCAGVHRRAATEILTPYPTTVRHNQAMDREELWETDPGRGKEGAWQRQRNCKSKRIQRKKERDGVQGWSVWPFHSVKSLRSRDLSGGATYLFAEFLGAGTDDAGVDAVCAGNPALSGKKNHGHVIIVG